MNQMTPDLLTELITKTHHAKQNQVKKAKESGEPELWIPLEQRLNEFDNLIEMEEQFKTALLEVRAWREHFPHYTYRRIDECIERVRP